MLIILLILFSIIAALLAIYGLVTKNFEFQGYMIIFLGLTMLVMGIQEFQKNKKYTGWLMVVVFALLLYVSIQSFIWV